MDQDALRKATERLGAVDPRSTGSTRAQMTSRRRRRAAVAGALLALLLVALALVLPAAGRDEPSSREPASADAPPLSSANGYDPPAPLAVPELPLPPAASVAGRAPAQEGTPVDFCPAAVPASGSPCSVAEGEAVTCGYPKEGGNVTCTCQATGRAPQAWTCAAERDRPEPASCPVLVPTTGSPCTPVSLRCSYDPGSHGTGCACRQTESGLGWQCVPYLEFIGR